MKILSLWNKIKSLFIKKEKKTDKIPYDPKQETFFDVDAHADPYEDKKDDVLDKDK